MRKCEHYTIDCEEEKRGCEGCSYYDKPEAKTDITYCTNKNCKSKCCRHVDNWKFDKEKAYSFMDRCKENV